VDFRKIVAILTLAFALAPAVASAQRNSGGNQGGAGAGGGRANRGNFQQIQMDRLKASLEATDDEWKVLEPKIQKVQELQRSSGRGAFGGGFAGGGRGGRRGGGGNGGAAAPAPDPATLSPVQQAARELQDVIANKDAKVEDVKAKLVAYRDARIKALADLTKAQDDLREVLTPRQEAVLVMSGTLN